MKDSVMLTNGVARGDNKLAKTRLRGSQSRHRSRHLSVFWSGLMLGIALPAFVDAIYLSELSPMYFNLSC
jgi:hypothetical protein